MALKMDNTLRFEDKEPTQDEWSTNRKSISSFVDIEHQGQSRETLNKQNIAVLPQEKTHTDRPIIPATWMEKLSFYRAFTSSSSKTEIMCMQQNNVNRFIWFYISNALCKSLSMTYVYIFLSSYAPDHHFFVPKMVPIFYGLKWVNIVCARFLLQTITFDAAVLLHYTIYGIIFKAPWNRCENKTMYWLKTDNHIKYACLELEEFARQFVNRTITFDVALYKDPNGEYFSAAQMEYYDYCETKYIHTLIWVIAAVLYDHLFKNYIWKILHYAQLASAMLLLLIFFHLIVCYEDKTIQRINAGEYEVNQEKLMDADFDMLAEAMTAPPVAHVLSARTATQIKPSLQSAVIVISNGIFYIFKALTTYLMKQYCERWVNATIIHWNYSSASNFYFWPIYFATFRYGSVVAVVYFALNAVVECCMFIITFQCLIEVVKHEWSWAKPWCMSAVILFFAIIEIFYFPFRDISSNSFIFYMSLSSLVEILIIFWMYPLERFLDDITFHFGVAPTKLRKWTFCFLPWFYSYKIVVMLSRLCSSIEHDWVFSNAHSPRHAPTSILTLLIVGAVYAIYKYVFKEKMGFQQLFKPMPGWGPKDFRLRQLRKQFDSREYVASQASRDLSRYLIDKSGLVSYKLDLTYDAKRKTTLPVDGIDTKQKER